MMIKSKKVILLIIISLMVSIIPASAVEMGVENDPNNGLDQGTSVIEDNRLEKLQEISISSVESSKVLPDQPESHSVETPDLEVNPTHYDIEGYYPPSQSDYNKELDPCIPTIMTIDIILTILPIFLTGWKILVSLRHARVKAASRLAQINLMESGRDLSSIQGQLEAKQMAQAGRPDPILANLNKEYQIAWDNYHAVEIEYSAAFKARSVAYQLRKFSRYWTKVSWAITGITLPISNIILQKTSEISVTIQNFIKYYLYSQKQPLNTKNYY